MLIPSVLLALVPPPRLGHQPSSEALIKRAHVASRRDVSHEILTDPSPRRALGKAIPSQFAYPITFEAVRLPAPGHKVRTHNHMQHFHQAAEISRNDREKISRRPSRQRRTAASKKSRDLRRRLSMTTPNKCHPRSSSCPSPPAHCCPRQAPVIKNAHRRQFNSLNRVYQLAGCGMGNIHTLIHGRFLLALNPLLRGLFLCTSHSECFTRVPGLCACQRTPFPSIALFSAANRSLK